MRKNSNDPIPFAKDIEMTDANIMEMSANSDCGMVRVTPEQFCKVFDGQVLRVEQQKSSVDNELLFRQVPTHVWHDGDVVHIGDDIVADSDNLSLMITFGINPHSDAEDKHWCAIEGVAIKKHEGVKYATDYDNSDAFKLYKPVCQCRPIGKYDGVDYRDLYYVGENGEVFSMIKGTRKTYLTPLRKMPTGPTGIYRSATISNGFEHHSIKIHRLVASAFIPNPDNLPEVNHLNLDTADNRADNLEWCTRTYNGNYSPVFHAFEKALPDVPCDVYIPHCQRITNEVVNNGADKAELIEMAVAEIKDQQ